MKELKKENVAVKVTANNVGKLRKLLAMFPGEKLCNDFTEKMEDNLNLHLHPFASLFSGCWCMSNSRVFDVKTLVTWKQLRAILAKEHLKAGDWVVCENKSIGVTEIIRVSRVDNESIHTEKCADLGGKTTKQGSGLYYLKYFKRYATSEEIQYFDNPHAEVNPAGKWCKFWDDDVDDKTICKYGKPSGGVIYPHEDIKGCVWRYYSIVPEPLQTQFSNL